MPKLPHATKLKLEAALAPGKLPESSSDPGYDDVFEAFGELVTEFGAAWEDPDATPAQRDVGALVSFWECIPWNGLLVGVAVNQPGVVAAALNAAKNLPVVARFLTDIQTHIPAIVVEMGDVEERLRWYESPEGEPHAAALADLEHAIQKGEFGEELLLGSLRRTVAESSDFYEDS